MSHKDASQNALSLVSDFAIKNKIFSAWCGGTALAACLALSPLPYGQIVGAALVSSTTVGAAVNESAQKRIKAAERTHAIDRSQFEADTKRLQSDREAIAQAQRDLDKAEQQLLAFQASLKTREATYRDKITFEAHRAAQQEALVIVAAKQAELEKAIADKGAMQLVYQEKSEKAAQAIAHTTVKSEQWRKDFGDVAAKTIETSNAVLTSERSEVNRILEQLRKNIELMAAELAQKKEEVAQLRGPKHFTQSSLEGQTGNRIMNFLGSRKVFVSGKDIGETKHGEVTFSFEPIGCDLKDIVEQVEAMQLHLSIIDIPNVFDGGDGTIKMTVRISSERQPKASLIRRVSDTQLRQAFLDIPFGLRFSGYTGRGKSTLMNNVIDLYEQEMKSRFIIFDPKVDFPSADYPNNKVYRGLDKCVGNIDLIGNVCKARQDYKVLNDEQGVPIPAQHQAPKLFLIDECKDIHDAAALADMELKAADRVNVKNFKFSIQKGLEVGRGLLVRVLYSTVTPDSSDFGFKNSVFKQSATVFLGDQCYEALGTKSQYLTTVSDIKKAQLRQEYDARVASNDERDQFIALFFNGLTNEIFFFSPPLPGAWMPQSSKPAFEGVAQALAQPSESKKPAVVPTLPIAQPCKESVQTQPSPKTSPALGQISPEAGLVIPSLAEVLQDGANCPECNAHSRSFKSKTPRKADSTVRLICKTKDCLSGGEFRTKVSD